MSETGHFDSDEMIFKNVMPLGKDRTVFFADDSTVARSQITRTLDAMQVKYISSHQWPPGLAGAEQDG